ncbi:undecaprenyl-diphosphate phosphatase [Leifsonia sp. Root112D2]|jgi:undecaprenyl-diphosphatase|uniref:undecaprenyl-diphosphate phosphatase n=1 Tax=Leifsonia sp. Root112D2 TaxID=1736426 RepID=UPI0006F4EA6C|nr:undecaprenyl-diphosphate phosphatase [Leifsonia sp. Root112D2]KQV08159.1 UDP-diphosphatase [Leifsonia sp. Root112D2]
MDFVNALILGLVQGLTEFLPVSSSAHIRIVGELLGLGGDPGARFTAIIQLGTEAAVVVFFWRDIVRIVKAWFLALFGRIPRNDPDARMGWLIIIGSIPIVVLGLLFQTAIETTFRSLWIIAATLIIFGIILGLADALGSSKRQLKDLTWGHGIIYGIAQAFALIPGVSRSGGTITAGRILGYDRATAARYSFLLAIPAVFGSGLYELYKSIKSPAPEIFNPIEIVAATIVAFVVGLVVIGLFLRYISHRSFLPFVLYRIALGIVIIVLILTGVLNA